MFVSYESSSTMVRQSLTRTFGWMSGALALTGAVAYYISTQPVLFKNLVAGGFVWVLFIAQLGLVFGLSAALPRLSVGTAGMMFALYSLLNGITLSPIFLMYTGASLTTAFFISAAMFGSMALYGALTKHDLGALSSIMTMALWGIIIAMVVNIFLQNSVLELVISCIGVVVFAVLTAYDVQQLKALFSQLIGRREDQQKIALLGALKLYLDFINMFLFILQIMGKRRNQ